MYIKYIFAILFFIPFSGFSQTYHFGSDEKYYKEDSLFMEWVKQLPKPSTDSGRVVFGEIVHDSIHKILKARNLNEYDYYVNYSSGDKRKYCDDLQHALGTESLQEFKQQLKNDSTKKTLIKRIPNEQALPD